MTWSPDAVRRRSKTCPWCWRRFRTVQERQAHQERENHPPEVFN